MVFQMIRKRRILTNNKEIYEKLNLLTFSSEVILRNVKKVQINKIISNINKHDKIVSIEMLGDYYLIKRNKPFNFNVYLR